MQLIYGTRQPFDNSQMLEAETFLTLMPPKKYGKTPPIFPTCDGESSFPGFNA
jgi:hypothetical protein